MNIDNKKHERTTVVFATAGLDVEAIGSKSLSASVVKAAEF